jgi:hypothetical protein
MQAVGRFCCGGKAMNEPSANSFFVVLLFILRCLVPLAILFGISYLLRRMGLVAIEAPEPKEEAVDEIVTEKPGKPASSPKLTSQTQPKKPQKKKVSPPRKQSAGKKSAAKAKAGNSRSRSK